ncbi:gamma-tubulin complex component 4 isoform X2 [Plodia interpunctella]|uniref:gamma-tubulin complex component 4 isoform X2 n=1 Tax=Plodia interpunctella TaxID=58824 RepID=UPI0023683566|nr:gamma-tubulin complex component 4 isoform X2 [Plodia interpunctella]
MIHDALLVLWDCSQATEESKHGNFKKYVEEGDAEIYQRICDVAKSHHKIQNFVAESGFHARKITVHKISGLYLQALSEGITEVLQSYKKTLLEVESLVIGNHNLTLSFVYSYVEKFCGLFNSLNKIICTVKERRLVGCQILSLTHQYILNGNEMVHASIVKIFTNINKVFINQLCTWLLYGELRDPYQEFFICRNNEGDSDTFLSSPSTNTCDKSLVSTLQDTTLDCGYMLNANMIPYFVPLSLAQEILFIGKTVILFGFDPRKVKRHSFMNNRTMLPLQRCSADARRFTIWEEKEAEFHEKLQKLKDPEVFEFCNFRGVIRDIKECVTKHLWSVAVEEAQLLHELNLMKDFYLLGRGELFLELLRLTAHMLDKPTTRTSTRDMNHAFQLAARAVFLSNSADIEKFSFELPYVKPNLSNNSFDDDSCTVADGWSTIILKYDFKWPLHLLFTPEVLARYNDVFRLLLRIKLTQHQLHELWKTYKHSTSFSMCQLHNKLMFLMDNLQHYLQADVLESNFSRLQAAAARARDFERLKLAHAAFLADVLSQSFLTVTTSSDSDCSGDTTDYINNPVFCNIMELLKLCHSFCSITDVGDRDYHLRGYSDRFNKLVKQLMQLLVSLRDRPCGVFLARLLMRLDYNRWLSGEARLTQSVTNMLRY